MKTRPRVRHHLSAPISAEQPDPAIRRFEFRIRGHVGAPALRAFPDLDAETDGADTLLRGLMADPAALYGVVAHMERLGLELVEIRPLSGDGVP